MKPRPLNEVVDEIIMILNEEIYADACGGLTTLVQDFPPLDYMSDGNVVIIRFFQLELWNSEDDMREINEEGEYTIDLQTHIRRLIRHRIKLISKISIGGPL